MFCYYPTARQRSRCNGSGRVRSTAGQSGASNERLSSSDAFHQAGSYRLCPDRAGIGHQTSDLRRSILPVIGLGGRVQSERHAAVLRSRHWLVYGCCNCKKKERGELESKHTMHARATACMFGVGGVRSKDSSPDHVTNCGCVEREGNP